MEETQKRVEDKAGVGVEGKARKTGGQRGPWKPLQAQFQEKGKEMFCTHLWVLQSLQSPVRSLFWVVFQGIRAFGGCPECAVIVGG